MQLEHTSGAKKQLRLPAGFRIKGCDMHGARVLVWSGAAVQVHEFDDSPGAPRSVGAFASAAVSGAIWDESLFLLTNGRVEVVNFAGRVKSTLPFMEAEGAPRVVHIAGGDKGAYVAAGTDQGYIKVWNIERREPKQHAAGRRLVPERSRITSVQVTADGSRVSATVELQAAPEPPAPGPRFGVKAPPPAWAPSSKLFVYVIEPDIVQDHDFGPSAEDNGAGRLPTVHLWDPVECTLLGVETRPQFSGVGSEEQPAHLEVVTMFSTAASAAQGGGLRMQNSFAADPRMEALVGVQVCVCAGSARASCGCLGPHWWGFAAIGARNPPPPPSGPLPVLREHRHEQRRRAARRRVAGALGEALQAVVSPCDVRHA